jgi:DNA-binding NtrC family response regulator
MTTLLIVDDDNLVRETLHELLSASYECHTADRSEQALHSTLDTHEEIFHALHY